MLAFIWAEDSAHHIGVDGHLPWRLPDDLQYFKHTTLNHPVVMGRRTFESFPHPLPHRHHVVLTHDRQLAAQYADNPQVEFVFDQDQLDDWLAAHEDELVFIIGGATLFRMYAKHVDRLYVTQIEGTFPADTTMPALDYEQFEEVRRVEGKVDEQNHYAHTFVVYQRKPE